MSASKEEKCNGCRHQTADFGGWCYLFETRPAPLPCGQHDKFSKEREIARKKFLEEMEL